jgi:acyl-CoA synthetase (AMP-forming)/AMP-acid ligase II
MPSPNSLVEILHAAPGERTAVILPEAGIRISYKGLREQVMTMASALSGAGIGRGDRVATVLPGGLQAIVSFLAASIAGTAAPLNPGYRQDEFRFYLEDTSAKILLCPPDGAEEARQAAQGKVPVYAVRMDESGFVRLLDAPGSRRDAVMPAPDDIALVLHTSGSTRRPKRVPICHSNLGASAQNIVNHSCPN